MPKAPMRTLRDMLAGSTWGRLLTPAEFEAVLLETRERHVPQNGYIARMGHPVDHWIGIIEGLGKMSVAAADGKTSTLAGVCADAWFGEGSLLKREPRRYDAVALRPTRIALVPAPTFQRLRETSLPFNHYLQTLMNARLGLFIGMLEGGRLLSTDARVARCLAQLFNPDLYPDPGPFVDLRQNEIGLLSGLSRQRVNTALHQLERIGLIRIESRGVTVLDLQGLRQYASAG